MSKNKFQGFLVYPKSSKNQPFLAILGKSENTPKKARNGIMYLSIFESGQKVAVEALTIDPASL
jgi:hypothetical protein